MSPYDAEYTIDDDNNDVARIMKLLIEIHLANFGDREYNIFVGGEDLDANNELLQAMREMIREENAPIKDEIRAINSRLNSVEESLQIVKKSQMRVELDQFPKIAAALDGAAGGNEKNQEQDSRISVLENKSENQGNRILALEYALKAEQ